MKITSCHLENFGSYKTLNFDFEQQGLALIQGSTGSGKSTLCDVISWVAFGRTAKDGAVDEVLSWPGDKVTKGVINVELGRTTRCQIVRTRGPNSKDNDLYINLPGPPEPTRGKDLNDTQKLINTLLGVDVALYLSGAYFHEFSQTAQFFITTAKNRRVICEQLVDLSLAKNLQQKLVEQYKAESRLEQSYTNSIQLYAEKIQYLAKRNDYLEKAENFENNKQIKLAEIESEITALKAKIKPDLYFAEADRELKGAKSALGDSTCSKCGGRINSKGHEKLAAMVSDLKQEMSVNHLHKRLLDKLLTTYREGESAKNTYIEVLEKMQADSDTAVKEHTKYKELLAETNQKIADIDLLQDVVNDFRGVTIKNTISNIESQTNKLLTDYYDSEIKVVFDVAEADKLDVMIYKDGNVCSYTQLSKGQRQLLKLCFGVSVMRSVSNHKGIKFNAVFFDEALDGMDDNFKTKTFRLLEGLSLEYESVFVVEHSENLKSMFSNKFTVELINGNSTISEQS